MGKKFDKINRAGFSERLNQALDKEGFPPIHKGRIQLLADMFGLSHRGVGKWISGETCPPLKKYHIIAEKLNVGTLWLQTGTGDMVRENTSPMPYSKSTYEVPLIKINNFGKQSIQPSQTVTCYANTIGETVALKLDTEAMSPRFPPGTIILVDTGKLAKDGDFVLAESINFPSPVFRQLLTIGDIRYLNAHNPKFDRLVLGTGDKIKGVIVQAVILF